MKDKYKGLIDRTPQEMMCAGLMACPQIYETGEGDYLIVGDCVNPEDAGLAERVNSDELLIKVPKKLIDEIIR